MTTVPSPVAVIVGLGPGLSSALAERFARGSFRIVGLSRHPERNQELAGRVGADGGRLDLARVDAADLDALGQEIGRVEREAGPIEVLIYNAYRATYAPPSHVPPPEMLGDLGVNVVGALAAAQAVLPGMRQRHRGTILLTGGGLALDPTGWLDAASLAVGKAGLRSLALSLNKELTPAGIHVATVTIAGMIAPGTAFAPDRVAEVFWQIHEDRGGTKLPELVYDGGSVDDTTSAAVPALALP